MNYLHYVPPTVDIMWWRLKYNKIHFVIFVSGKTELLHLTYLQVRFLGLFDAYE